VYLHDLHHFTATQFIHAGMDIRTAADFLGHSDPSLTLGVYSHAIEEAAAVLGISRAIAYNAVSRGEIPCIRIGRRILIPKVALERLLDGGGEAGADGEKP